MTLQNPLALARKHLTWLASMGSFVAVPSVKTPWRRKEAEWRYRTFSPQLVLRELLPGEIVIEFDGYEGQTRAEAERLVSQTCDKLDADGLRYIVFDHGGKSPHIHLWVAGLDVIPKQQRRRYKERFIQRYAADPGKADLSLAGEHLIATEYLFHWKYNTRKVEVRNMLEKSRILGVVAVECARCGLKRSEYVDARGVLYCALCSEGAHGEA